VIAVAWWQALLDGLSWLLAQLYDLVPSYGVAIILLTVGIRIILLPLGIKQIRSMHSMQALQPKVKALQTKYKGNKQKLNEETMKLYREHGVNPFSGCWPMLLQIPVLAALYSVLQYPQHPPHLPEESLLRERIERQLYVTGEEEGTGFLGMNLLCSSLEAGQQRERVDQHQDAVGTNRETLRLDCGRGIPVRIPYYVLAAAMIFTTYYQQKQMQRASPPGASAQQQTLTRVMPLLFGVWGILFPAGLVLYWTTSNAWQIGQQHFILKARKEMEEEATKTGRGDGKRPPSGRKGALPAKGPSPKSSAKAAPRSTVKQPPRSGGKSSRGQPSGGKPSSAKPSQPASPTASTPGARKGRLGSMIERAEQERARRLGQSSSKAPNPSEPPSSASLDSTPDGTGGDGASSSEGRRGTTGAGDRKKRRKR
jgi:YidC/Oxa1 family membrane protein insertase